MPSDTIAPGRPLPVELEQMLSGPTEIASLPEITTRIVQVIEDPRATAHDMHEIVRTDPALASKILKVVNSAFYGLPSQVGSLDRAIILLGPSAVKNIALAASLSRMFDANAISEQFNARDLWRHCVAVAVCVRLLAAKSKSIAPDEAFVAGLVHDVGLIAVQQLFPAKLKDLADRCRDTPQCLCALEESLIGADHQAFGSALARKWNFPPSLRHVVGCHHDPSDLLSEKTRLTAAVYAADTVCCLQRYGFWLTGQDQEVPGEVLQVLGLAPECLDQIVNELPEQVEQAEQIFN